jgi:MOSC domain-containing protein YiiM
MTAPPGQIVSVNVGAPQVVRWRDRNVLTSIFKDPVQGRVAVRDVNIIGDDQADRSMHGGPDKAVYAYARDDLEWWSERLGVLVSPGVFGENLTVTGMAVTRAVIGEPSSTDLRTASQCRPPPMCSTATARGPPSCWLLPSWPKAGRAGRGCCSTAGASRHRPNDLPII